MFSQPGCSGGGNVVFNFKAIIAREIFPMEDDTMGDRLHMEADD